MRDFETISTALTAAETGHLVMSTLHTLDAVETINRIISVFPPYQQKQVRLQLASVLRESFRSAWSPKRMDAGGSLRWRFWSPPRRFGRRSSIPKNAAGS